MSYEKVINQKELEEEKGLYYPYLMQILGCPVIQGVLIPKTSLKYLYVRDLEGIVDTLLGIKNVKKGESIEEAEYLFPQVVREDLIFSMEWALADCFNDGCDLEDYDSEQAFAFLDKEVAVYIGDPNARYYDNKDYVQRPKYKGRIITKETANLLEMFN